MIDSAFADLATVESISTLLLYVAMGAFWAYVGYRRNRAARGEAWQSRKALSTFVAGGGVGLAIVLSGHTFDSMYVIAVSGFLVPFLDKLWNAATTATETATDMAHAGASVPEIALEVAEVVDREVDIEDAMAIVAEYERRFGTLDPDPEHVDQRAAELKELYEQEGPAGVSKEFDELDTAMDPYPGLYTDPDPDYDYDPDADGDTDTDPGSDPDFTTSPEPDPSISDADSYTWPTSTFIGRSGTDEDGEDEDEDNDENENENENEDDDYDGGMHETA